jgi:hypothetical protein
MVQANFTFSILSIIEVDHRPIDAAKDRSAHTGVDFGNLHEYICTAGTWFARNCGEGLMGTSLVCSLLRMRALGLHVHSKSTNVHHRICVNEHLL